jgi:hypothetical protein
MIGELAVFRKKNQQVGYAALASGKKGNNVKIFHKY